MGRHDKLRDLHWTYPPLAAFLGALGGWSWLWLRRFLLPGLGTCLALAYGVQRWQAAAYLVTSAVAFSLPYSPDRHSWLVILLVGASYGVPPLLLRRKGARLGLGWAAPLLTGVTLLSLLWISAHLPWWTHKWSETLVFGLYGWLTAYVLERNQYGKSCAPVDGALVAGQENGGNEANYQAQGDWR